MRRKAWSVDGLVTCRARDQWDAFKQAPPTHPEITAVTASMATPAGARFLRDELSGGRGREGRGTDGSVDFRYFETYGIEVLAGRTFSESSAPTGPRRRPRKIPSVGSLVLSFLAAREFGWSPEKRWQAARDQHPQPVSAQCPRTGRRRGRRRHSGPSAAPSSRRSTRCRPTISSPVIRNASLKVTGKDLPATLAFIDSTWASFTRRAGEPSLRGCGFRGATKRRRARRICSRCFRARDLRRVPRALGLLVHDGAAHEGDRHPQGARSTCWKSSFC